MAKATHPAAPKKTKPAAAAPDTPPKSSGAPAPEKKQEQAGAGETQMSGKNGPDPVIGLRITSSREGFRRAGFAWSKTPAEIPLADLSDDQVAMLRAEPMLTVEDITIEAAAE